MREIALDTETTGILLRDGHRIIEIGALELMHHLPTGRKLHLYINPERNIDDGAVAVHGINSDFLADKPVFANIVDEFLAFVGDDPLVIHNASFDNTMPVTQKNTSSFSIKSNFTHILSLSTD